MKDLRERAIEPYRERVAADLHTRFDIRGHVSIIAVVTFTFGFLIDRVMLATGESNMAWRYLWAILLSYGVFFLLIRIWLGYVGYSRRDEDEPDFHPDVDMPIPILHSSARSDVAPPPLVGGGGTFDGGGASGSWADADDGVANSVLPAGAGISADSGGDFLGGQKPPIPEKAGNLFLLVLAVVAIVVFLATALYSVWILPHTLVDVALESALAAGLIKTTLPVQAEGWMLALLKRTAVPAVVMLVVVCVATTVLQRHFPDARTMPDIIGKLRG